MKRAILYLRSSKDRSDVSIDAQRRELQELATQKNLAIINEYIDVVESAKTENRAGFQQILLELKNRNRDWDTILTLDTSRLSRRQYIAYVFDHECKKHGVEVHYAKIPDMDPITGMVVMGVLRVFDEFHSLMSREKGLAGMAENVRQGFRGAGTAPTGYVLETINTGTIRDGEPVTKKRLALSADAPKVGAYLKARAAFEPRATTIRRLGLEWSPSTLVGIEWNALTYAGHTTFLMYNEKTEGGSGRFKGHVKRRPRKDWMVTRNTHPALITDEEAERILTTLEASPHAAAKRRQRDVPYLLNELLISSDGQRWRGEGGKFYRYGNKGRRVSSRVLEDMIMGQLMNDLTSERFAWIMLKKLKKVTPCGASIDYSKQIATLSQKIRRLTDLLTSTSAPHILLARIEELDVEKQHLVKEMQGNADSAKEIHMMQNITGEDIQKLLKNLASDLSEETTIDAKKAIFRSFLDRVELDPDHLTCRIFYKIPSEGGFNMVLPRGFEPLLPT